MTTLPSPDDAAATARSQQDLALPPGDVRPLCRLKTVFAETILRSAKAGGRCLPWGYSCNPHSVLSSPDQRPARECSPGATGRVQGQQPIEV